MKKMLLPGAFSLLTCAAAAQPIPSQSIQDSVIGWMKVYNYKGAKEPLKVDNKVYSMAQLSIADSFANWIQASYVPKGGLGNVKRAVLPKMGLYDQYNASLPPSYGAYAAIYTNLKYNAAGKMEPVTNFDFSWGIMANAVPGWPVLHLCTPSQYYFTMPSFEASSDPEAVKKHHDLTHVPNLKPYITFWVKNIEAGNGTDYVLLCRNNQSPFIKLTKGEYLQLMETAIPRFYEAEKKKISQQNPGNQRMIDYLVKSLDERRDRFTTCLKQNREKYKGRLNELALTSAQPSISDLETGRDLFSNGYLTDTESTSNRVPVYKVDPAAAELCKKDKPQWILMHWWWAPNDVPERHLHESIINNFNFDYVYNFFFDPEKVKGQPYKPLRSPFTKEKVVLTEASAASKKNATDKNIFFFEDFSTTSIGSRPVGWKTNLGLQGDPAIVTRLNGLDGNWVMMNDDYSIAPVQLKSPFPQDFTLSYDVIAARNFTWGAKGLSFQLSGSGGSYIQLRLRPGFDGRDGEVTFETKFPAGYVSGTKWLVAHGFSNNKEHNRVAVVIKKVGETLQVFIDDKKIVDLEKAMPAEQVFNAMSFSSGSSGETNKYYVGNVKVVRENRINKH